MPTVAQENHIAAHAHAGADVPDLPALLRAASAGDEAAWRRIIDLYARRVYALARSRLGGDARKSSGSAQPSASSDRRAASDAAEEITQSVFVTIASKLTAGEYTEQGRFESWLFRVAMNRVRDEARRIRRQATPTDPDLLTAATCQPTEPTDDHKPEIHALRLALGELTEPDREIIELRHHAGMSFKQMSEMLEEPLGTLLARHHRALRKLKELISRSPDAGALLEGNPS